MKDDSFAKFLQWIMDYNSNPEFAERCELYIETLNANRRKLQESPVTKMNEREKARDAFESLTAKFCLVMQEHMSREQTDIVKKCMMYAFDSERGFEWFASRNGQPVNIPMYCRLIYYLHIRGFFDGATCCNKRLTIGSIAHILAGHDSCDKDAVCDNRKYIIAPNYAAWSSLNTYMKTSTDNSGFEKFCMSLVPKDFF